MRILFLTQVVDEEHPALAQTIDMVDALARRCEVVAVLCDRVGRHALPPDVRLRTFGAPSRIGRGLAFERTLAAEVLPRGARPDAVLAHMVPLFLLLAAPFCRPFRIPLALWYTHWHAGRSLRLATRAASVVLSVDSSSFPLVTPKLRPIGHAIDVGRFELARPRQGERSRLRLLALGRMTPWKGYTTMLRGLELAVEGGLDAELEIRGPALNDGERTHLAELRCLVGASEILRERVRLEPPLPRDRVPDLLRDADALLSATQPEAGQTVDKVVLEAAAAGLPVLSSNGALEELLAGTGLPLRFARGDAADLARSLRALGGASPDARARAGELLRERVVAGHSVDAWADAVVGALHAASPERK